MTDKDIVKDLVREVLVENPELVRQQGIAKDRAKLENYVREISAPAQPRSPVDAYDAPVEQTDTALPLRSIFYADPSTPPPPVPESTPALPMRTVRACDEERNPILISVPYQEVS